MVGGREELLQENVIMLLVANLANEWATLFASLLIQQNVQLKKSLLSSNKSLYRDAIDQMHSFRSPLRESKHNSGSV